MFISIPDADIEGYHNSLEVAYRSLSADAHPNHYARIRYMANQVEREVNRRSYGYIQKSAGSIVYTKEDRA